MWELRSSEFKLTFIPASALLAMRAIYIGQLLRPAAAPLTMCMRVHLGGVAMVCDYPHPTISSIDPIITVEKISQYTNHSNYVIILQKNCLNRGHDNVHPLTNMLFRIVQTVCVCPNRHPAGGGKNSPVVLLRYTNCILVIKCMGRLLKFKPSCLAENSPNFVWINIFMSPLLSPWYVTITPRKTLIKFWLFLSILVNFDWILQCWAMTKYILIIIRVSK